MKRRMGGVGGQGERMITRMRRNTPSIYLAMLLCCSHPSVSWVIRLICFLYRNEKWRLVSCQFSFIRAPQVSCNTGLLSLAVMKAVYIIVGWRECVLALD